MSRRLFFLCCLFAVHAALAEGGWKPSAEAVKQKLHAVIRGQLEAFRRNDFAAAYEFAAPGIREKFPVTAFAEMVKNSYPEIAAHAEAQRAAKTAAFMNRTGCRQCDLPKLWTARP